MESIHRRAPVLVLVLAIAAPLWPSVGPPRTLDKRRPIGPIGSRVTAAAAAAGRLESGPSRPGRANIDLGRNCCQRPPNGSRAGEPVCSVLKSAPSSSPPRPELLKSKLGIASRPAASKHSASKHLGPSEALCGHLCLAGSTRRRPHRPTGPKVTERLPTEAPSGDPLADRLYLDRLRAPAGPPSDGRAPTSGADCGPGQVAAGDKLRTQQKATSVVPPRGPNCVYLCKGHYLQCLLLPLAGGAG